MNQRPGQQHSSCPLLCIKQFTGLFPLRSNPCVSFRRTSCESSTGPVGQRISSARFALQANLRTSSSRVFVLVEGLRKSTALLRCFWLAPVGQRIFIRQVCLAGKLANFLFGSFRPYRGIKKKAPHYYGAFFLMAPPVGLEPTTLRLTAACSTD